MMQQHSKYFAAGSLNLTSHFSGTDQMELDTHGLNERVNNDSQPSVAHSPKWNLFRSSYQFSGTDQLDTHSNQTVDNDSHPSVVHGPKWNLSRRYELLSSKPLMLSEPARNVLEVIRKTYGKRSCYTTPSHVYNKSKDHHQSSYTIPRRQLFSTAECSEESSGSKTRAVYSQSILSTCYPPPSCGIQQRLDNVAERIGLGVSSMKKANQSAVNDCTSDSNHKNQPEAEEANSTRPSAPGLPQQQKHITNFFRGKKPACDCKDKSKQSDGCHQSKMVKTNTSDLPCKSRVLEVDSMSTAERTSLEYNLLFADEVACTLLFDDGSSLIRPSKQKRKRCHDEHKSVEPCAIAFALPWHEKPINGANGNQDARTASLAFVKMLLQPRNEEMKIWTRTMIGQIMESKTRKICYDAQALTKSLTNNFGYDSKAVSLHWIFMDVKIAAWMLDPDHPPKTYTDVLQLSGLSGAYAKENDDSDELICRDLVTLGPALVTLFHRLKSNNLWDLFWNLEMRLCPILAVMEMQGIQVDTGILLDASDVLKKKIQKVEVEAHKAAGHPFLINSPQQLRQILFDELKLDQKCKKKLAKTSIKNHTSTSEAVLIHLQEFHPLPRIVLEYRQLVKLRSTYFDGILPFVKNGLLRTNWEHAAAATGRLTSSNPNLQNVPKQPIQVSGVKNQYIAGKDEEVIRIFPRDAYKSQKGWSFIAADFQSIELRLLAHLSNDPDLLKIFNGKISTDVFTTLTSQWLGIPPENVQFQERERTKRIVYSVIYGVGRERLANTLGVGTDEAKGFMESFLGKFPGINEFTRKCIDDCKKNGFVSTLFQRKRWLRHISSPDFYIRSQAERQAVNFVVQGFVSTLFQRKRWLRHISSPDFYIRSQAERQAVNFVVQGSAADLCKSGMIQVVHAINKDSSIDARLLLQIHDELLLEVADGNVEQVKELVKSIMESSEMLCGERVTLKVPLPVSISTGKVWSKMETSVHNTKPVV